MRASLPHASLARQADALRSLGLGVELRAEDLAEWRAAAADVEVTAVQAYRMHEWHPLHADAAVARRAQEYLRAVVRDAHHAGVARVVCACGFGATSAQDPLARCADFFSSLSDVARASGVRLCIEPLSTLRCTQMHDPRDVARLLAELGDEDVFGTVLDTGHLLDGGHDPLRIAREWRHRVDVLQLRGAAGTAPRVEDLDVRALVRACPGAHVSVEHHERLDEGAWRALVTELGACLPECQ